LDFLEGNVGLGIVEGARFRAKEVLGPALEAELDALPECISSLMNLLFVNTVCRKRRAFF
jgi:hypothetical protein